MSAVCGVGRCELGYRSKLDPTDVRRLEVACDDPNLLACKGCGLEVVAKCGTARESVCVPCSTAYRGRVGIVAGSGYRWSPDGVYFLTLTAPGAVRHRLPSGQWCPCTPVAGCDLAAWNARASRRWNDFVTDVRRKYGDVVYFKAVEVQRRGALHLHVIMRWPDHAGPPSLTRLRRLAIAHGFGHSVDLQGVRAEHAGYVAKYVAKAADQRVDVPWFGSKLQRGRAVVTSDGELLGYVFPNGDLEDRTRRTWPSWSPSYRTWTASRAWGDTMAGVLAAQRHFLLCVARLDPLGDNAPDVAALVPARPDGPPPDPGA